MNFLIADTFQSSLARLTGAEQKAAKTAAFDLQLDSTGKGKSFRRLDRAHDHKASINGTFVINSCRRVWASLDSDISRPFPRPSAGRIAVKVINHLGDEVMKVFGV